MLFVVGLLFASSAVGQGPNCEVPPSFHFDFCKIIPFWHHHAVHIGKELAFVHDVKAKMDDGTAITVNDIDLVDLVIPNCQAIGEKNNITVKVEGLGIDLTGTGASTNFNGKVQAHVVVGDVEFNLHECKAAMTGKFSGYGPPTVQSYKGAGIPDFRWSKASSRLLAAPQGTLRDDTSIALDRISPMLSTFVARATAKAMRPDKVDWCKFVQPLMGKTLNCSPAISLDKYINHGQPVDIKPGKGKIPKIPFVDDITISNFRITEFVSPVCDVEGPPFLFNVTVKSEGPKALIKMDVAAHACMWILFVKVCKTFHLTVAVNLQVPYEVDIYVHEVMELDERVEVVPFGFDVSYKSGESSNVSRVQDATPPPGEECQTQAECDAKATNYTMHEITAQVASGELGEELRGAFQKVLKNATALPSAEKTYVLV